MSVSFLPWAEELNMATTTWMEPLCLVFPMDFRISVPLNWRREGISLPWRTMQEGMWWSLEARLPTELFQGANPVGKYVEMLGRKVMVIGVLEKEGKGTFDAFILDEVAILPIQYYKGFIDIRSEMSNPADLGEGQTQCECGGADL